MSYIFTTTEARAKLGELLQNVLKPQIMEHAKHMDVYRNNSGVVMAQLAEPGEGMKELFFK